MHPNDWFVPIIIVGLVLVGAGPFMLCMFLPWLGERLVNPRRSLRSFLDQCVRDVGW